jgi:PilZ domain-containing protein
VGLVSPRPDQKSPRYRRRVEVHYNAEGSPARIGYSGNVSTSGMMLRTPRVLAPGTLLTLELRFPQRRIVLAGRVAWAREGPLTLLSTGRIGMGIKFIDPPAELADLLQAASAPTGTGTS